MATIRCYEGMGGGIQAGIFIPRGETGGVTAGAVERAIQKALADLRINLEAIA